VLETVAKAYSDGNGNFTWIYLRIRNNGNYPIIVTKILGGSTNISKAWTSGWAPDAPLSGRVRLAPGEEFVFGYANYFPGVPDLGAGNRTFFSFSGSDIDPVIDTYNANLKNAAASLCSRTQPYGYLVVNNFGFEYTETVEGQTVTKRQVGTAPFMVQCMTSVN
jgi:hypothetical protein